jgi:pimeloyl-ACP methyl ester carboxylesterase/DNA-binding winged helix-turn-helix (wHTH) protein
MSPSFATFRLDAETGRLLKSGHPVALTPKAYALLQYLVERPGRLITKAELLAAVWPGVFVGDAVLKSTISEVRRALGDNPASPRFIETAHRRGYRFIATIRQEAGAEDPAVQERDPVLQSSPSVRYARSGRVNIAYQVIGDGPPDLVFVMGWVSHLEYFWREPSFAHFLRRLTSFGRLILFDKRGTGLSDAVPVDELPTLDERLDDVRAVMDAAGSTRAVLVGVSEGGPLCSLFAATYPEKTDALIMIGSYARRMRDVDYPWGPTREERDAFLETIVREWGGPVGLDVRGPSRMHDPAFREWWAAYLRMGASPGAAVALTRMNAEIDIRDLLPSIQVPTLVIHRMGDQCLRVEEGRFLASRIRGAEFVELEGADHLPFLGDQESLFAAIETFLARAHVRTTPDLSLASVVTLVPRPDDAGADLRRGFERAVTASRGRLASQSSDRLAAVFEGPRRAVQCALAAVRSAAASRPLASAGVHVGECDLTRPAGPIFDISAAMAARARAGEVLVSRTIVDLVPGSGLEFDERGSMPLPNRHRELALFAVKTASEVDVGG